MLLNITAPLLQDKLAKIYSLINIEKNKIQVLILGKPILPERIDNLLAPEESFRVKENTIASPR
ncbi:hypothetical protein EAW55_04185 [Legionella jordanis]|uniref:hypothetical protein n=1 Tax=Legionella jordanis TaxID=456 RepID=UPI0007D09AAC|nr:hypothetical protein [Legionella jordanis]RMX04641.1 hypothetical protein EAW55_04185 [Legionella jordanis]RMX18351.1 hypothetical protein EAS68_08370 [Legionella jordanis]